MSHESDVIQWYKNGHYFNLAWYLFNTLLSKHNLKMMKMKSFFDKLNPSKLVLFLSFAMTVYYSIYGVMRIYPDDWNKRLARNNYEEWLKDVDFAELHKYYDNSSFPSDITIVSAYFNIGTSAKYTPSKYKKWMSVFRRINNPLIFYTDSETVLEFFKELRAKFPPDLTKLYLVKRDQLWSFSLASRIKEIFAQPGYPKFPPNTIDENYSCVMHAKFELVTKAIRERLLTTKYIAWLDIGLFRAVTHESYIFPLTLPNNFDHNKIAYSGVKSFDSSLSPRDVISNNLVWVGGAMFLGVADVMYIYAQDYMATVEKLLDMKLMSTDQQVIYIMYLPSFSFIPRVEIQIFTSNSKDDWFYIGYIIKDKEDRQFRESLQLSYFFWQRLN